MCMAPFCSCPNRTLRTCLSIRTPIGGSPAVRLGGPTPLPTSPVISTNPKTSLSTEHGAHLPLALRRPPRSLYRVPDPYGQLHRRERSFLCGTGTLLVTAPASTTVSPRRVGHSQHCSPPCPAVCAASRSGLRSMVRGAGSVGLSPLGPRHVSGSAGPRIHPASWSRVPPVPQLSINPGAPMGQAHCADVGSPVQTGNTLPLCSSRLGADTSQSRVWGRAGRCRWPPHALTQNPGPTAPSEHEKVPSQVPSPRNGVSFTASPPRKTSRSTAPAPVGRTRVHKRTDGCDLSQDCYDLAGRQRSAGGSRPVRKVPAFPVATAGTTAPWQPGARSWAQASAVACSAPPSPPNAIFFTLPHFQAAFVGKERRRTSGTGRTSVHTTLRKE